MLWISHLTALRHRIVSAIGDSLSSFSQASASIDTNATTDTLNVADGAANGELFVVPPSTGTFTKTVHKTGSQDSKVYSMSRIGYVRLDNTTGQKIKIGNANLGLTQRHCFGILFRIPNTSTQLTGYAGDFDLVSTSQNGGSGNALFKMSVGGKTSATNGALERGFGFMRREGFAASVAASIFENSAVANTYYGAFPDLWNSQNGGFFGEGLWTWLWCLGSDNINGGSDVAFTSINQSDDGSGARAVNTVRMAHAIHGITASEGCLSSRWNTQPAFTNGVVAGINPVALTNVDFVLGSGSSGTGKIVDIARVIKLSTFPCGSALTGGNIGYNVIAEMCNGMHPDALGLMSGDDFCLDFGSLPSNCTNINSAVFNPAEDGPVVQRYHGLDTTDVTLNITNQRVS